MYKTLPHRLWRRERNPAAPPKFHRVLWRKCVFSSWYAIVTTPSSQEIRSGRPRRSPFRMLPFVLSPRLVNKVKLIMSWGEKKKKWVAVSKHFEAEETSRNLIPLLGSVSCFSSDHTWVNPGKEHGAGIGPPQSTSQFHHSESADLGKLCDQCLFQASHLKKQDNT